MNRITTLFWDVGGVMLSNAWDQESRRAAAKRFGLDWNDFQTRHEGIVSGFETGKIGLDEYLDWTIFYQPRSCGKEEFKLFMLGESHANPETLGIVEELARSGKYLMATLNNESVELNLYRINRFHLRSTFTVFFSSGFVGTRKPMESIYRLALRATQRSPQECLFIDDRASNLEPAHLFGINTIHYQSPAQLRYDLERYNVGVDPQQVVHF